MNLSLPFVDLPSASGLAPGPGLAPEPGPGLQSAGPPAPPPVGPRPALLWQPEPPSPAPPSASTLAGRQAALWSAEPLHTLGAIEALEAPEPYTASGLSPADGASTDPALQPWPSDRLLHTPDAATGPAPDLARLHPGLWRASQVGGGPQRCTASGFAPLDAQLPGGGWPHGVLTELLLPQPGIGELRLLAPALTALDNTARGGQGLPCVMLFDPPARLSAWALAQQGLDARHWLVVSSRASPARAAPRQPRGAGGLAPLLPAADVLWALEQALRSGQVAAVLAWLPLNLGADALRRLQLAAQAHDGPAFVLRDAAARSRPSPAPLRLLLQPAGVDALALRVLKRRGPPLAEPLRLQLPSVLTPRQQAQAVTRQALQGAQRVAQRAPCSG